MLACAHSVKTEQPLCVEVGEAHVCDDSGCDSWQCRCVPVSWVFDWREFFQLKTMLTLTQTEWELGRQEVERVGIFDCIKFQALPDIGPHQSFNKSTRNILQSFNDSTYETLLFLEDDVVFKDLAHLGIALSELPVDWDIVYLGANLLNGEPERYSEHLFRVKSAWTTHAIGYNKKVIPFLLEHQPPFSEMMFDCWMDGQLARLNAFVVAPMVAYQRHHVSAIWGTSEDYTPIFEASEEKLR